MSVVTSDIATLNGLEAHCDSGPADRRAYPPELQVFEVVGRIIAVRLEQDHDFHVALVDVADPNQHIVTEVVDPDCSGAVSSRFHQQLSDARLSFQGLVTDHPQGLEGRLVRVRGVGFFDFDHGQTGRSRSCVELHPVLGVQLLE
jgi:hypothetical protein